MVEKLYKKQSGITLIEVLIYVGILSVLLLVLISFTFNTLASVDQLNNKITLEQEGGYLASKIDWAVNGASAINYPPVNSSGGNLALTFGTSLTFNPAGQYLLLNGIRLNSQNVIVANFLATHTKDSSNIESLNVSFDAALINQPNVLENFQVTKYFYQ